MQCGAHCSRKHNIKQRYMIDTARRKNPVSMRKIVAKWKIKRYHIPKNKNTIDGYQKFIGQ
jgi:hypothetical protein